MLKTLRRFKDEVKEVREGTECGMGFENYNDIQKVMMGVLKLRKSQEV